MVEPLLLKVWVRQLGWLFLICGKIKYVPNHQQVEVPTICKAYDFGLCKGRSPQNMGLMVLYLHFRILKLPLKLVGGWFLPLWKIWVGQLGLWHSQLNRKMKKVPNHQPAYDHKKNGPKETKRCIHFIHLNGNLMKNERQNWDWNQHCPIQGSFSYPISLSHASLSSRDDNIFLRVFGGELVPNKAEFISLQYVMFESPNMYPYGSNRTLLGSGTREWINYNLEG